MDFDKNNKIMQIPKISETVSRFRTPIIEKPNTAKNQNNSEPPEEIFRGLFFYDEQYQDRSGARWQLFG